MRISNKAFNVLRWLAWLLSIAILAFGLPFYFGYGNPLPFLDPSYDFLDNLWLIVFPLMFLGLLIALKFPKIGGWIVTIAVGGGLLINLAIRSSFPQHMFVPLAVGILNLVVGYRKPK